MLSSVVGLILLRMDGSKLVRRKDGRLSSSRQSTAKELVAHLSDNCHWLHRNRTAAVNSARLETDQSSKFRYVCPDPETGEPLGKVVRAVGDLRAVYGRNARD